MLELRGLTKVFRARPHDVVAADDITFAVRRGELVSLLGPSGCGKTTTLRLVAGFETPTSGSIQLAGRDVTRLPPQKRQTGMVFQNYALFPHLDVFENVAFGLRTRGDDRPDVLRRVGRALELVDLTGYGARQVQELSGGQQQRVALARAIAPEPPLLLLDEPLSNLDAALRERTRLELRMLLKHLGMTAVFVTHDQDEAFALADRIALLDHGRLQQYDTPDELYRRPSNPFVAGFIGHANFLDGTVRTAAAERLDVEVAAGAVWPARAVAGMTADVGDRVRLMVRPESLQLMHGSTGQDGRSLAGSVRERRFAGPFTSVIVDAAGAELTIHARDTRVVPGETVNVVAAGGVVAFPAGP
ncbi:MAG: ABC transporter ATP-binding protein [Gemmatimonadota bacterium]